MPDSYTTPLSTNGALSPSADAWDIVLAAAGMGSPDTGEQTYAWSPVDGLFSVARDDPRALLHHCPRRGWETLAIADDPVRDLLELYLPVCNADAGHPLTIGHLGQSLDGFIATDAGDSCFVTGPENILHLHRMRAVCDAVVVGPSTVAQDNPRLTARLAAGSSPARVVLDPAGRLGADHELFRDGAAPTLLFCEQARALGRSAIGQAEVIGVPSDRGRLDLRQVLRELHRRDLTALFIEGGGVTVSHFLELGLLDRLQLAIAPLLIGSGRPGIRLPPREPLAECLRPAHRLYQMGQDLLYDCDLRVTSPSISAVAASTPRRLR
jgi:riboflavin-specific deaminase-like protein